MKLIMKDAVWVSSNPKMPCLRGMRLDYKMPGIIFRYDFESAERPGPGKRSTASFRVGLPLTACAFVCTMSVLDILRSNGTTQHNLPSTMFAKKEVVVLRCVSISLVVSFPVRLDCILGTATNINKSELFDPFEHRITSLRVYCY